MNMLVQILKPSVMIIARENVQNIRMISSLRYKSHSSTEVQHGTHHNHDDNKVDYHDPYRINYERLWRQKATLDWLPKAEGNWQEINGKKQAYYNKVLAYGVVAFTVSLIYLRTVIVSGSGALTKPPYDLIGNEDFPGSKYDNTTTSQHN